MLPLPTGSEEATLVGMDPGTSMLGTCVLTFNLSTLVPTHIRARTYDGAKLSGSEWSAYLHGNRFRRIEAHRTNLTRLFDEYQPIVIGSESPFYNSRMPNAFGALTEVMCAIRAAVQDYSLWRPLYLVPPSNVKRAIDASAGAKKDAVKLALKARTDLADISDIPIDDLDEHSIDAIAVAAYLLHCLRTTLPDHVG